MPRRSVIQRENERQRLQKDDDFLVVGVYFFELLFPAEALAGDVGGGATSQFVFPLVIPPQAIEVTDSFSQQLVGGSVGSLYAEENGILRRTLSIRGTTGFRPRRSPNNSALAANIEFQTARPSFDFRPSGPADIYSGQRHFHFLQDRVFRIYGDLKRDPRFAADTQMNFLNPRDREAWRIIPEAFRMVQQTRNLYVYDIRATIVDRAQPVRQETILEPDSLFEQINGYINLANGSINDVIGVITEIDREVSGALSVFNNAVSALRNIENALTAAENGITRIATLPLNQLKSAVVAVESLASRLTNFPARVANTVAFSFRQLSDALEGFTVNTDFWRAYPSQRLRDAQKRSPTRSRYSVDELTFASENAPTSLQLFGQRVNGPLPGDIERVNGSPYPDPADPQIQGKRSVRVLRGDTLGTLSTRYLGTPNRWREIAALNNLRYPYISDAGGPGTLTPGDLILVPSTATAPEISSPKGIIGVPLDADEPERLLGRDLKLQQLPDGRFDLVIDNLSGKTDVETVAGVQNLQQGLATRVTTVLGEDALFPNLGTQRVIATRNASIDRNLVISRITQAIQNDPRVAGVPDINVGQASQGDQLVLDFTASVRGFSDPVVVETRTEPLIVEGT